MAKLGSVAHYSSEGQSDVKVSLCSLGVMLCMLIAVLGIKLRWFKKRIHFDQLPTGGHTSAENGQVVLRRSSRSSQEQFSEPVVTQGIFRKRLDEDMIIERPKTLPPVRIRKSSKGTLLFGPPKKNTIPPCIVEEPVVIPPPPPPLPSASSLSLAAMAGAGSSLQTVKEDRVNFDSTVEIISSEEENNNTSEPLHTEEIHMNRQLSERKQTGYVRPSDDIIAELQKLADEASDNQYFEDEPPKIQPRKLPPAAEYKNSNGKLPEVQPRTSILDKPKEKFKKNTSNTIKGNTEWHKEEEEHVEERKLSNRRLTGVFPSPEDNHVDLNGFEWKPSKVVFQVDDEDYERYSPSPPLMSQPMLFNSQLSNEDEQDSTDSWSAIQRHRNLTKEINEQQEVNTQNDQQLTQFHNSTDQQQQEQQHKDMKRNNARNDLLLHSERDYNNA